jgi:hypothetical protein
MHAWWFEPGVDGASQNDTAATSLALFKGQKSRTGRGLEYIVDAFSAQAGAFQISLGANIPGNGLALVFGDESHRLLAHLLDRDGVFAQILLQADEDDGDAGAQSGGLFDPLLNKRSVSDVPHM